MSDWRAEMVYAHVKAHPGLSAYEVALALDMPESTVYSALMSAERLGLLLYEDKEGKLHIAEESNEKQKAHL